MVDPLSVAGLVTGVISLGLQTYQGISTYLDAVQCRDEEIASVRRKNDSLHRALSAIKVSMSRLKQQNQLSTLTLTACHESCKAEIQALERFMAGILACDSISPEWIKRVKLQVKKLNYAFDRPKIQQLETRLDQTISVLQLALQSLGM